MERFLLFTYETYYPEGGMNDFNSSYRTLEEATERGRHLIKELYFAHAHVFDRETGETHTIVEDDEDAE